MIKSFPFLIYQLFDIRYDTLVYQRTIMDVVSKLFKQRTIIATVEHAIAAILRSINVPTFKKIRYFDP